MKFRNYLFLAAAAAFTFAACSNFDDDMTEDDGANTGEEFRLPDFPEDVETVSGEVSGNWTSDVYVDGHITVPEGKTLTISEGVTVYFNGAGAGVNHAAIEFSVDGNLYCLGTEEEPVTLTVYGGSTIPETEKMNGYWGGIVAGLSCAEMLIDHTVIEYTGGQVIEGSPAVENGYYTAGDDAYPQITTNNVNGKYVITNSVIRNGWSDGIYMMGGQAIITGNIFSATGYDGAEAVNVKAGCKVDVARNIMFSPNTNGLKLSSSDQDDAAGRTQALVCAYNNTVINAGWRRDGEKGGSIYVEENANVSVFNNLLVNCKFRAITPEWGTAGAEDRYDRENSMIDYNFYASGTVQSHLFFEGTYDDDGETLSYSGVKFPYEGYAYKHDEYDTEKVDVNSKIAGSAEQASELDPEFVNYNIDADPALYGWDDSWDFHVQAGSPVLSGAYSAGDRQPYFLASGLAVNGKTYNSPAVGAYFGAFGEAE